MTFISKYCLSFSLWHGKRSVFSVNRSENLGRVGTGAYCVGEHFVALQGTHIFMFLFLIFFYAFSKCINFFFQKT